MAGIGRKRWAAAACAVVMAAGGASAAKAPQLDVLRSIAPGRWQLHPIGGGSPDRAVCVANPERLVQLHHAGRRCARFVITNAPDTATVHYTCPGAGHGRTTIRAEANELIAIDTQGIADGLPFQEQLEARRLGECAAR